MKLVLALVRRPNLVRAVAGIAPHVQCGMAAASLGNVDALIVAPEAEILVSVPRRRLHQQVLVGGNVGIVAGQTIPGYGSVRR